jgi:iron complex transport system substrate-binding protein
MVNTKVIAVAAVAIIAVAAVGGFLVLNNNNNKNDSQDPGFVTDAVGNKIDLSKEYKNIASGTAVGTEIVCDLGMKSSLVAVTNSAHIYDMTAHVSGISLSFDYPSTIATEIAAGTLTALKWSWSVEQVADTEADLMLLDYSSVTADDSKMKQLQELGITCVVLFAENDWDTICKNYTTMGKILKKEARATEINDAAVAADAKIMSKFTSQTGKKIAYICHCYGKYYIYNQSGLMDAALKLGCTNALATSTTTTITPEQIAAANPDFIFFDDMGTSLNWTDVIAEWKADAVMGSITAIANDEFCCMEACPFQATSYPTIHYVMGEGLVATMIYPDVVSKTVSTVVTDDNYVALIDWLDA